MAKTRAEIAAAVTVGVRALLVDSLFELDRIAEVAAEVGRRAAVAPRIDVHVPTTTHPGLETAHGGKAGIDRDDTAEAFGRAAADPWLEPVGLHLHVGSQITGVAPYRQAMKAALDLVAEAEAATGVRLQFLDAGGGFAVPFAERSVPGRRRLLPLAGEPRRVRGRGLRRARRAAAGPRAVRRARPLHRGHDRRARHARREREDEARARRRRAG